MTDPYEYFIAAVGVTLGVLTGGGLAILVLACVGAVVEAVERWGSKDVHRQ